MAQNGANTTTKPNVLILGGVGFIGRNLVHYMVCNDLANKIRVVDKVLPPMAWLSSQHKESFSKVEFKHANLINAKSTASIFTTSDGTTFDFVINCAAETKLGQSEAVYRDGIYKLSCNCAHQAAMANVRRYIELSSARMFSAHKNAIKETTECEPWTQLAKHKLMVERELKTMSSELDYVIVRPAIVYGPGDRSGITPRLVIGSVYKFLHEKMRMLWTEDLKMNTVHVQDVVRALWHLCNHGVAGEIYNLSDKGDNTQGKIGAVISEIFNINHDYVGSIVSNFAKLSIGEVVEEVNEKHMAPWGELCQKSGIQSTPLTPFIDEELVLNKELCVDGTKIEQLGFRYEVPVMTVELVREVLEEFATIGIFPASMLQP